MKQDESVFPPISTANVEWQEGIPCAPDFSDSYFSRSGGLQETSHVFLQGNQLADRFAVMPAGSYFVICETGFGTGLNFYAATRLFLEHAPPDSTLHFFSIEKHPLTARDMRLAAAAWPDLDDLSAEFLQNYPHPVPGFHRRWLADNRVALTLLYGPVEQMLPMLTTAADAWFLDGFAPSRNAAMWTADILSGVASLMTPGGTLATYSAAGHVRRTLENAGLRINRESGFADKREMLTASTPGNWQARQARRGNAVIAGAGLAGASCARALAERGWQVQVLDPAGVARRGSGNLAGTLYIAASGHPTPQNRYYQSSYLHAISTMQRMGFPDSEDSGRLNGVVHHTTGQKHLDRFTHAMASGYWPETLLGRMDQQQFIYHQAGYISPADWCRHLLSHPLVNVRHAQLNHFENDGEQWQLGLSGGETLHGDVLVLAIAEAVRDIPSLNWLPCKLIRGQVTYCAATPESSQWTRAHCHASYLTPPLKGIHCAGATFDLHDLTPLPRDADNQRNLEELRHYLPEHWQALGGTDISISGARVGYRHQTKDFLPVAGAIQPDAAGLPLYVSLGHGSRGITSTPLCAELLSALICGEPLPLDPILQRAIDPVRFYPADSLE